MSIIKVIKLERENGNMILSKRVNIFLLLFFSTIILSYPAIALDYESLLNSQIKPNTLIVFSGDVQEMENYLNEKNVRPMHIFPSEGSSAIIAYQPKYIEDSIIIENGNVVKIFHELVSLDMVQEYGEEVVYATVAFDNLILFEYPEVLPRG